MLSRRAGGAGSGLAVGTRAKWPTVRRRERRRSQVTVAVPEGQVLDRAPDARALQSTALWDEIVEIESDGDDQVYDLTVPDHPQLRRRPTCSCTTPRSRSAWQRTRRSKRSGRCCSSRSRWATSSSPSACSRAEARVDSTQVRNGRLIETDWSKIGHAIGRLARRPLWIDDNPNVTVMEIRAKARRLKSRDRRPRHGRRSTTSS